MVGVGETFALDLHISSYLICGTYFIVEIVPVRFRAVQAGRRGGLGLLGGGISPGPLDTLGGGSVPHPTWGWVLKRHRGQACMCMCEHSREMIGTPIGY